MSAEFTHTLPAGEVPASCRAVVRAAEDELAGADDAVDRRLVAFQHRHARTRRHVPLADRLIGAPAHHVRILDQDAVDVVVIYVFSSYQLSALVSR